MKLPENCYCLTGLSHSDCFSVNAGFVTGENETVIIDSGFNIESARTIHGYAKAAAHRNRISHVINLEEHLDHVLGNRFFIERGAKIITHKSVNLEQKNIEDYIRFSNDRITLKRRRENKEAYIFFKGVVPFKPDIAIDEDTDLKIDGVTIRIYLAPGHTEKNLIAYVEEEKVAYVADTIYSGYLPTLRFGNKGLWKSWLDSLDLLEGLNPDVVVPGHGEVLIGSSIDDEIKRHRKILRKRLEE